MGKLWIYGDSYAASFDYLPDGIVPWTQQVANKLGLEPIYKAKHGSSIDFMIYESINDVSNYKEDDTCIFILTEIHRAWLISNDPSSSYPNFREYDIDHHASLRKASLTCWLHAIENYTNHLQIKPIIISAWDPELSFKPTRLGWAKGELSKASLDEIIFSDREEKEHPSTECRYNHLTLPNHEKLSSMVIDWFLYGSEIDCNKLHKMVIPLTDFPKA